MVRTIFPKTHRWRWKKVLLCVCILVGLLFGLCRIAAKHLLETLALTTGPNGSETPATFGVPYERTAIPSGSRHLDSYVVTANSPCIDPPVLLIYHGVRETISEWAKAQSFLYHRCVSSVVFDPTGSGNSSRPARFEQIEEDSTSAYAFTRRHFPGKRIYVLGHSMGNGPMLEAVLHFSSPPAGVVVANAFVSLRSYGGVKRNVFYRILAHTIPDWWDNVKAIREIHSPLLVIHSDMDQVNPLAGGKAIFAAARPPKRLIILHGFRHNALSQNPDNQWWEGVLVFVKAPIPE